MQRPSGTGEWKADVCRACGKQIGSTISGSITAWIFKDSCCTCSGSRETLQEPSLEQQRELPGETVAPVETTPAPPRAPKRDLLAGPARGSSDLVSGSRLDAIVRKIVDPPPYGDATLSTDASSADNSTLPIADSISSGTGSSSFSRRADSSSTAVSAERAQLLAVSAPSAVAEKAVVSYLPPNSPTKFGERYEMVDVVGEGGMAMVYKVKDLVLNQFFAIKVIHPELAKDAHSRKRFEMEAATARVLNHANVVTMYAFDISPDGIPYLIMEYVEGQNLSTILAEKTLPLSTFYDTFIQVCSALAHAHSRAVVHRDIKPSNILVANLGAKHIWIKLADFGIAKMLAPGGEDAKTLTQTGDFLGSPFYVSPEQAVGDEIDARSDIYSLGCVMFHALTGRPPFNAPSNVKIILQQINDMPPSLASLASNIPPSLERIIHRCLEKRPEDRYQNVFDLRSDLQLVQEGEEPQLRRSKKEPARELSELLDLHKEDKKLNTVFEGVLSFDMRINNVLERIIELAVPGDSLLRVESANPDFTGIIAIRDGYQVLGAKILKQPIQGYQAFRKIMSLADGVFRYQSIFYTDYRLPDDSLQINLNYILFLYPSIPESPAELVDQAALRDLVFAVQSDETINSSAIADDTREVSEKTSEISNLGFDDDEERWVALGQNQNEKPRSKFAGVGGLAASADEELGTAKRPVSKKQSIIATKLAALLKNYKLEVAMSIGVAVLLIFLALFSAIAINKSTAPKAVVSGSAVQKAKTSKNSVKAGKATNKKRKKHATKRSP